MRKPTRKAIALILLAGTGERFGSKKPKQFVDIDGKPLMAYSLCGYQNCPYVDEIALVCLKGTSKEVLKIVKEYGATKVTGVFMGGSSRRESALMGLRALKEEGIAANGDIVIIADGDRPNVDCETVRKNIEAAIEKGAAVTAAPCSDSVFFSTLGYEAENYLPRKMVFLAKTPQTFIFKDILSAHEKVDAEKKKGSFTDDASIYRILKKSCSLVESPKDNIKITTPEDVKVFLSLRK